MLLGIISIFDLPIEQYPDITPPVVEVSTTYPGADAETVNNAVATPVSQSIMGVSDMLYMQATSANDGSMNTAGDLRYRIRSEHWTLFLRRTMFRRPFRNFPRR
mgnify:CR=1 FL=1